MKLYSSWSPNPHKTLFASRELGLATEVVDLDLFRGEQRTDAFTALNPMQKVPVIEDGDFKLWESNAILAYWGEREGRLWPTSVRGRADALRWLFFEARHLSEYIGAMWFYDSVAPKVGVPVDNYAVARARKELARPMQVLDQCLVPGPWVLGEAFSLVDCSIGPDLAALSSSTFDWSPYPAAAAYLSRVREHAGWRASNPRSPMRNP